MRIRFISSTPRNVFQGSGTHVGIETLARSIRDLGVRVDLVAPRLQFPILTAQRLLFNQSLRFRRRNGYDVTVGFDMDGDTVAGDTRAGPRPHVASIKGVIADEMRFESGLTKITMGLQASCEAEHVRRADLVITTSAYAAGQICHLYRVSEPPRIIPEPIDLGGMGGFVPKRRAAASG